MSMEVADRQPVSQAAQEFKQQIAELRRLAQTTSSAAEAREIISRIAQISRKFRIQNAIGSSRSPVDLAQEIDPNYVSRPHLEFLNQKIVSAVREVERGHNQQLAVSMPPRAGKSTMTSLHSPLWILQRHPEWSVVMTSYDGALTGAWAREIRRVIEDRPNLGVALKRDGGAGGYWETIEGGGMYTTGIGGALTGRGAKVMIIDDPIADFVSAHSPRIRQNLWNWWLSVAQTRLEPPYLVLTVMTRWHEDDFVGRLLSTEYEGRPDDWTQIVLPAIADNSDDILGRREGDPLYTPLLEETREQAIRRWDDVKSAVGTYTWSGMYQQRPAPQQGAIFDMSWWRYWTVDPSKATADGQVRYMGQGSFGPGQWVDSWDCTFKGASDSGDFVVGQRWVRQQADCFLIAQKRERWTFTQTIDQMKEWAKVDNPMQSPYGQHVHQRLVENTANGPAILDVLQRTIDGLKAVNPHASKEARARSVTPGIESGNVYLPHPTDPGNEWVQDLLSELRNFPFDAHDDQVDALTQALAFLRGVGTGQVTVPGANPKNPKLTRIPSSINRTVSNPLVNRPRF